MDSSTTAVESKYCLNRRGNLATTTIAMAFPFVVEGSMDTLASGRHLLATDPVDIVAFAIACSSLDCTLAVAFVGTSGLGSRTVD